MAKETPAASADAAKTPNPPAPSAAPATAPPASEENPLATIELGGVSIPDHTASAKPDGKLVTDHDSAAPASRSNVGRSARARQLRPLPARQPELFRVTHGATAQDVEALDESEAWAKFCDNQKSWPSPAGRTVEKLGPVAV